MIEEHRRAVVVDLSRRTSWLLSYREEPVPEPPLDEEHQARVTQVLEAWKKVGENTLVVAPAVDKVPVGWVY
jgi:hypothetical protein